MGAEEESRWSDASQTPRVVWSLYLSRHQIALKLMKHRVDDWWSGPCGAGRRVTMDEEEGHSASEVVSSGAPEGGESEHELRLPPAPYGLNEFLAGAPQATPTQPSSTSLPLLPSFSPSQSPTPGSPQSVLRPPDDWSSSRPDSVARQPTTPRASAGLSRAKSANRWIVIALSIAVVVVVAVLAVPRLTKSSPVVITTPVSSTEQDFATQLNVGGASLYLKYAYSPDGMTFSGMTPAKLVASDPHDNLTWVSASTDSTNGDTMSLAASGSTATIASMSATGACWFARINMQIDGGRVPNGTQFAGSMGGACNALHPPTSGWNSQFPPRN